MLLVFKIRDERKSIRVDSLEEAAREYAAARDTENVGASELSPGIVFALGLPFATISYNGRVTQT